MPPEENVNPTILGGEPEVSAVNPDPAISGNDLPENASPAPAATGEYDYSAMVGANGALADNWRDGLPESIRSEKCLDSIKTVQTLAQSFVHGQHAIGAGKVAIPTENSTPEEWNSFYKSIGRPDSEDAYDASKVELPDGIALDDEQVKSFRSFAFAHGMTQKQFNDALAYDVQRCQAQVAAAQQARTEEYNTTLAKLQSEFGGNFSSVIAQCNKAMDVFGLKDVLTEKGLLSNYTIIKALAGIGERISESRLKGSDFIPVANDPQTRLNEITQNPDDPYYKKDHPAHNARIEEVGRLMKAISAAARK